MPIHDWTRVTAGTWHDFHLAWIAEIRNALNGGLLPPSYYVQAEQIAGPLGPDVLTLQTPELPPDLGIEEPSTGGLAVATVPPRARLVDEAEMSDYVLKRRALVIRHVSGDRIVALLELVSPGNKSARFALRSFVDKAVEALFRGYHLLIVDLLPAYPPRSARDSRSHLGRARQRLLHAAARRAADPGGVLGRPGQEGIR